MIQKIYGVKNLHDWTVTIKAGAASLRVYFEGGTTTVRGIIPATYSTADPVKQAIIERSDYYKHGRIYLVQQIEMPDDAEAKARKNWRERIAKRHAEGADAGKNDSEMDGNKTETPTVDAGKNDSEMDGNETEVDGGVVKVADKSEAIEWLKENYPDKGYTATKLRSKDAFEAACKECGVVFEIAE